MKKLIILSLAVVAMAGCQKDDKSWANESGDVVSFSSTSLATRLNSVTQEWESGDRVGIFMYDHSKSEYGYSNIEYGAIPNSDASTAQFKAVNADETILYPNGSDVTFSAYYPHDSKAVMAADIADMSRVIDISDQSDLGAIDFMVAGDKKVEWSDNSTSTKVAFDFEHKLTKVVFNVEAQQTITDLSNYEASFLGMQDGIEKEARYNLKGEKIESISMIEFPESLNLYVEHDINDSRKATVTAILHPCDDFKAVLLLREGGEMNNSTSVRYSESSLKGGYKYEYKVVVGEDYVAFSGESSITPWGDGVPTDNSIDAATKIYPIYTAEDLKKIGNEYPLNGNYKLFDNITLDINEPWQAIGNVILETQTFDGFSGTFDGDNYTISGLNIYGDAINQDVYALGLFSNTTNSAVIKNLNVEGRIEVVGNVSNDFSTIGSDHNVLFIGGIVGQNMGLIDNCSAKMDIIIKNCNSVSAVAQIVGASLGTVTNSVSRNGSIQLEYNRSVYMLGGVVGMGLNTVVQGCSNEFDMVLNYGDNFLGDGEIHHIGGIVGKSQLLSVIDCHNDAKIEISSEIDNLYIGGIVGDMAQGSSTIDCYNSGNLGGKNTSYIGGIAGFTMSYSNIVNCYNISNQIEGYKRVGGIVGNAGSGTSITNCYNQSYIAAMSYAGGIAGSVSDKASIVNCAASGDLYAAKDSNNTNVEPSNVGGLIGSVSESSESNVIACYSASKIIYNGSGSIATLDNFIGSYSALNILDCYVKGSTTHDDVVVVVDDMLNDSFVEDLNAAAARFNESEYFNDKKACSWKLVGDGTTPIPDFTTYVSASNSSVN